VAKDGCFTRWRRKLGDSRIISPLGRVGKGKLVLSRWVYVEDRTPTVMIRASGRSCLRRSLGQQHPFSDQVPRGVPPRPWTKTMLWGLRFSDRHLICQVDGRPVVSKLTLPHMARLGADIALRDWGRSFRNCKGGAQSLKQQFMQDTRHVDRYFAGHAGGVRSIDIHGAYKVLREAYDACRISIRRV